MNNNIQDPNNQVSTQAQAPVQQTPAAPVEPPFDPRTVQPSVIGELRKDRIGKPILVLEMLVMFGIVMVALPIVYSIANDEKSALYKWIHKDEVVVPDDNPTDITYLDGSVLQILDSGTSMKYNGIVIQAFKLSDGKINCRIYSLNEKIDFDEEEYYLEIYSNSQDKIAAIKLSGIYDYTPKDTVLTAGGLSFNTNLKYYGKMVKMTDASYPEITYNKDANEVGSFTCINANNNHIIKYTFKNDYLLSIEETYKFVKTEYDDASYLDLYSEYQTKSSNLGEGISSTEEDADGFTFKASLNLEGGYKIPDTVTDNNYYEKDTKAKVIHYAETGKGFECK